MSNDERKQYFLLFGIALKQHVDTLGWENKWNYTEQLFIWCLITTRTITVNHAHRPKWKIIGLIRHFANIPHLALHTVEQDKEWHGLLAVPHKLRIYFTVLTGGVAPPTRGKPNQWAHSCLRGVWKTLVCLSQRPCANGSRGGLCSVGCSLQKISACGAVHTLPTGSSWSRDLQLSSAHCCYKENKD